MSGTAARPVEIGHEAPDFTLPSTTGEDITLSSYRGRSTVVLAFFPAAFTGVCTREMCEFSTAFTRFEGANATVLGISVDSIPALNAFKTMHGIAVPLLSDFKREVARAYGVLLEEHFFAKRAYVIVDPEGIVTWVHVEDDLDDRRDVAELLARLTA